MGSRLVTLAARERYGSDERVDGGETVGNSLGPGESSGGKERYGRDDRADGGKPWEIAWGELRGKGARWKRRQGGRRGATTWWTSEIAWGEFRWEGAKWKRRQSELLGRSEMEATTGWTKGQLWEIAWGELRGESARIAWGEHRWEVARWKRRQGGRRGNRGK